MKDLINIFLMTVVVLGWAMLEVTGCGYAVLAIPVVYWLKPMLDLLRKYSRLNLTFWFLLLFFLGKVLLLAGYSMVCSLPPKMLMQAMQAEKKALYGSF